MKKIMLVIGILLLIFVGLIYISVSGTPEKFRTCEILGASDIDKIDFKAYDSVLVAANTIYEANELKRVIQGDQYRDAWATPISVPIMFLDTMKGGMRIMEEGGGQQTHSLDLKAADGTVFTLRGIAKDPEPLVPEVAERLGLENIIIDGVSAQHPYAALVVAALAEKADVLHTHPKIYFLPKQSALENFNDKFGNRLFLLEYETEGKADWTGLQNATEIVDTEKLQELKSEYPDHLTVDKAALVKARLFDILIGDWDRHAKQWGWVVVKKDGASQALPLPCDRDNAFFNMEGVLPTLISNKTFLPRVQTFGEKVEYMEGLVGPFDVYFLKGVPQQVFLDQAKALQNSMTDEVISEAFQIWPKNVYALNGADIISHMHHRRKDLSAYAKQIHQILNDRELLSKPLKGSEDLNLSNELLACFDCGEGRQP